MTSDQLSGRVALIFKAVNVVDWLVMVNVLMLSLFATKFNVFVFAVIAACEAGT